MSKKKTFFCHFFDKKNNFFVRRGAAPFFKRREGSFISFPAWYFNIMLSMFIRPFRFNNVLGPTVRISLMCWSVILLNPLYVPVFLFVMFL